MQGHLASILLLALLSGITQRVSGQDIRFNELMPANASVLADQYGDFSDWLELHNASTEPVSLAGLGISDRKDDPFKWTAPDLTLGPGEFRVIHASGKDTTGYNGEWDAVVVQGDRWRFISPASEPASSWTNPGFDDSSWQEGPSGLGYGDGDDATVVSRTLSVYARIRFDVDDLAAVERTIVHMDYDDGFVAYLNGTEVARANIGQAGVRPRYDEPADTFTEPRSVLGLPPQRFIIENPSSLLRSGENILAVQVHNSSIGSSDLSCIPYLTLGISSAAGSVRAPPIEIAADFSTEIHTNFRLSAQGEALYLTDPTRQLVDSVRFGAMLPDISLGRQPDGMGDWFFFGDPTPGEANTTPAYQALAEAPAFSHLGGRYSAPLSVSLSAPAGGDVYLTTDGSEPDADAFRYVGPIHITKTTVLRARTLGTGLLPSEIVTHTFVYGEDPTLPVVSIATDPALLWDNDIGIYAFPPDDQAECPSFPYFCANFWEDREIKAHLEVLEPDGAQALSAGAGLTIVGGWSRGFPQKSLGLFARGRYGSPAFNYALFPDRPYSSYQSFLLRNSGNDWDDTMLRDGFIQELVAGANVDRMEYRPAVVYLNGRYWGIHNIREKINEHYAAALGGVDADEVDIIALDTDQPPGVPEVVGGDAEHYEQLISFVGSADMRSSTALEFVETMMDVDSYVDYMITQIFVGNTDWPGNNVKLWRPRTPDGKWRWILFDLDFGFGRWNPGDYVHNTLAFAAQSNGPEWPNPPWSTFLFRRLLENAGFRNAFVNRYADFLNTYFKTDAMLAVLDSVQNLISDEIPDHVGRWGGSYSGWVSSLSNMRFYARNRSGAAESHLRSFFALSGSESVTISATDGGSVIVNRLHLRDFPWTGSYYPNVPLSITAVSDRGYRFAGWTGSLESSDRMVEVNPNQPLTLAATFEVATRVDHPVHINEIQYHAATDMDSDDWIEIANRGQEELDVSHWRLSDGGGNVFDVPRGTAIAAGGYLVLARSPAAFSGVYPGVEPMSGGWVFGLSNGGDAVYLRDEAGFVVDSVTFGDLPPWPVEADGGGSTLELIDPLADNSLALSWRASAVRGGTPGATNSVFTGTEGDDSLPKGYLLGQPFPNPFAVSTTIPYATPTAGRVSLRVFDTLGRLVATIADGAVAAGYHTVTWEATALPSGVYFLQMISGHGEVKSLPVVVVR
ncbi:MAG: CotH kinase family protein [Rhodothermia bacterium]|nr:CotH kinase family protein [Rhodothermia bacterium]